MNAVQLESPGHFRRVELPEPGPPGPGEALVRIDAAGMCGTDWHAFAGRQPFFTYPRILGHELGVTVLEIGPGEGPSPIRPGDRCSVEPYLNDPDSPASRRGRPNCCQRLEVLGVHTDGGMRERMILPVRKLHPSSSLDLETLALVETLGIGAHAVERGRPAAGDDVLVLGAGPIGLSVIQFALLAGARVLVSDPRPERQAFCRLHLPQAEVLASGPEGADDGLREACSGRLPNLVFDASGNAGSMTRSLALADHGGTVVWVGITPETVGVPDPEFHRKELTLLASRNSTPATFRSVLGALEAGDIQTGWWITHRVPWEQSPEILARLASEPSVLKAVVHFSEAAGS